MTPWEILGAHPDIAVADLRRRYAALIKAFRPETHPQDFARIREAYELALPWARRREAEQAEAAAEVPAVPEVIGPAPTAEPAAAADEPGLAARFHAFRALAESAEGARDEALLPALHALLRARTGATLDEGQALEFALMRWFIESDQPPLTLLFETGRAFDWHEQVTRLGGWLGPSALRRMEARLALSRDRVFARHFSVNICLRHLHAADRCRALIVARPSAIEALAWAERWQRVSADADAPALADCLDARALRGLRGFATTDVLVGIAVALASPDATSGVVLGLAATLFVLLARLGLQAIARLAPTHRANVLLRAVFRQRVIAGVVVAVMGAVAMSVIGDTPPGPGQMVVAAVLVTPLALLATALAWRCAAWLERVIAWPFQWREAVQRLAFDRLMRSRAALPDGVALARGAGLIARLRAIPAALRLQAREVAARQRPPRAVPLMLRRGAVGRRRPNVWRLLWFGAWVLFAILRVAHVIGSGP
jgi:hypothetical protein